MRAGLSTGAPVTSLKIHALVLYNDVWICGLTLPTHVPFHTISIDGLITFINTSVNDARANTHCREFVHRKGGSRIEVRVHIIQF